MPSTSNDAERTEREAAQGGHAGHGKHEAAHTDGGGSPSREPNKWLTLVAVCLGTFMLLLDVTIVNVALPDIQTSLKASFSDLQWVVDAYALTLAACIADRRVARRHVRATAALLHRPGRLHHRLDAVRVRPEQSVPRAFPRRPGRRRRHHVLGLAGPARRRIPRQGPRRRLRHLGRHHRRRRRDRPAARRRTDQRA